MARTALTQAMLQAPTRFEWRSEGENRRGERQRRQLWRHDWIRISTETGHDGCQQRWLPLYGKRRRYQQSGFGHGGAVPFRTSCLSHAAPWPTRAQRSQPAVDQPQPLCLSDLSSVSENPIRRAHPLPSLFSCGRFRCDSRQWPVGNRHQCWIQDAAIGLLWQSLWKTRTVTARRPSAAGTVNPRHLYGKDAGSPMQCRPASPLSSSPAKHCRQHRLRGPEREAGL